MNAARQDLRTLVRIISSTPRVILSGCSKARFAGNSGAIAKNCNAAAAAQDQPNVEIILTRVLSALESLDSALYHPATRYETSHAHILALSTGRLACGSNYSTSDRRTQSRAHELWRA